MIHLILCLQQTGEIDNLTVSWDKVLGCVVCRFHVGDIPNRYTSDVVLNQQARVAHQGWYGGFAILGGPVAEVGTAVPDAGAYGGFGDKPMAGYWRRAYGGSAGRLMADDLVTHA
jgi:hypothetical protein